VKNWLYRVVLYWVHEGMIKEAGHIDSTACTPSQIITAVVRN